MLFIQFDTSVTVRLGKVRSRRVLVIFPRRFSCKAFTRAIHKQFKVMGGGEGGDATLAKIQLLQKPPLKDLIKDKDIRFFEKGRFFIADSGGFVVGPDSRKITIMRFYSLLKPYLEYVWLYIRYLTTYN